MPQEENIGAQLAIDWSCMQCTAIDNNSNEQNIVIHNHIKSTVSFAPLLVLLQNVQNPRKSATITTIRDDVYISL